METGTLLMRQQDRDRLVALKKAQKGLIGWIDDATLLVVGTGKDGRWERFRIGESSGPGDEAVQRSVWRDGWKRYLGS